MKKLSTLCCFLLIISIATFSSCSKSSSDAGAPPELVTTPVVIDAAGTTAMSGGYLTSGSATAYGVVYSSSNPAPTLSDQTTSETVSYGSYSSTVTGLTPNTTYYLRAYATYAGSTGYGNVVEFKTGADLSTTSATVATFAGQLAGGFLNGTGTAALFSSPMGIATDADGNVYVADAFNSAIRKITTGGKVTTIAGTGTLGFVNGTAEVAQFYAPSALVLDAAGNIYVADRGNNAIRKITAAGVVTTLAGSGEAGYADGTGSAATFNTPIGIALDATGNLYVSDYGNNIIRKVTAAGVVTTIAGSRTVGYANGIGTAANFNKPAGIALDAAGNIYVAEAINHAIRKIDADLLVTTFTGGTAATTWLGNPNGLTIDASGNFWITDTNGRILKINTDKKLTVQAGTYGTPGATDGVGTTALFNYPTGIAVGLGGSAYVADFGNNLIRKVN